MIRTYSVFDDTIREPDTKEEEPKEGLTDRQQALYELILSNSIIYRRKTTQREIVDSLGYLGYTWKESNNTADHCTMIWSDIAAINLDPNRKLIITKNYEYWIGNKPETKAFIDKLWADLEPRLFRFWKYLKKIEKDGQYDIFKQRFVNLFNEFQIGEGDK